jgi:hypothetical protein
MLLVLFVVQVMKTLRQERAASRCSRAESAPFAPNERSFPRMREAIYDIYVQVNV